MKELWVALLIAGFALGVNLLRLWLEHMKAQPKDFDAEMTRMAAEAVEMARKAYGVDLDYGVESVKEVEGILARMLESHNSIPGPDLSAKALVWGAYIGEVIKRLRGGQWQMTSQRLEPNEWPVFGDEMNSASPCEWVYKRLKIGREENVWAKFEVAATRNSMKQIQAQ